MSKWHDEIDIFRKIKPCIVLEGNILDQFQYPNEPYRNRYLSDYLHKYFKTCGYEVAVIYDEANGFYLASDAEETDLSDFARLCGVKNYHEGDKTIPCTFSGGEALSSTPATLVDVQKKQLRIGEILIDALGQPDTSVAIIMDMASRYIVSPEQMQLSDVRAYTDILRALRLSAETEIDGKFTKNVVVLIVNKLNDLPTWFYLNNPDVKVVNIPTPTAEMRMEFVSGERMKQFFHPSVYERDMQVLQSNPDQLDKILKKFVGITEGFSYSDLIGLRTLCYNEEYHIPQLANVVDLYRYGIKENKWATVDRSTVQKLENDMFTNILGQENALKKVMDVIKRSVVSGANSSSARPKGVLFFAGPTGTGKTETAKALARNIFGDESCCIRFDMAEYKQSHSDQKLLGAPPGYVGYEAGGQLTNAVRSNPFSIILFDEIEKAHPSILDKFLQILDDGRLTDGQGKTVYFSESIIIFTSNKGIVGAVEEGNEYGGVSVRNKQLIDPLQYTSYNEMQQKVVDEIRNYFKYELGRPELLNRIGEDNIVVYDFIRPETAPAILSLHVQSMQRSFEEDKGIKIDLQEIESTLVAKCCSQDVLQYGGRGIRNFVESYLYTPLTRYVYDKLVVAGKTIVVKSLDFTMTPVELSAEVVQ